MSFDLERDYSPFPFAYGWSRGRGKFSSEKHVATV